jgi:outer membrane immunogenic protein
MRRFILSSVLALCAISGAFAADMKGYTTVTTVQTGNIWQGAYVGVTFGGASDYQSVSGKGAGIDSIGTNSYSEGLRAGYDYVVNSWLIGAWIDGSLEQGGASVGGYNIQARGSWAVGGRAGYIIAPNILAYAKLGYTNATFSSNIPGTPLSGLNGVTSGGGFEYALTNSVFVAMEYRHDEYQSKPFLFSDQSNINDNRVNIALTYKFGNGNGAPFNISPLK